MATAGVVYGTYNGAHLRFFFPPPSVHPHNVTSHHQHGIQNQAWLASQELFIQSLFLGSLPEGFLQGFYMYGTQQVSPMHPTRLLHCNHSHMHLHMVFRLWLATTYSPQVLSL